MGINQMVLKKPIASLRMKMQTQLMMKKMTKKKLKEKLLIKTMFNPT